jgi:hypothetical protein
MLTVSWLGPPQLRLMSSGSNLGWAGLATDAPVTGELAEDTGSTEPLAAG